MKRTRLFAQPLLAALFASLLGGCAHVDTRPSPSLTVAEPGDWSAFMRASGVEQGNAPEPLWKTIGDEQLVALIGDALEANIDIAIARSRVREARANERAQIAAQGPNIGLGASAAGQRQSENGVIPAGRVPGIETEFGLFDATFDAAWELDLFGRKRARRDIARLRTESQEEVLRDVQTSLIAEVSRNYMRLRGAQAEAAHLDTIIARQRSLLAAMQLKRRHGERSDLDVERSASQLAEYRARLPANETAMRGAIYRLSVLTAREPDALTARLLAGSPLPSADPAISADLGTDVLRRRPDVRKAERDYIVAARSRDLKALDIYPAISLFASGGPNAKSLSDIFKTASLAANLGAMASWPLFDGGRVKAETNAAEERRVQAELAYRSAVLNALEEVESAALRYVQAGSERDEATEILERRRRIAEMEHLRFRGGTGTTVDILTAERERAEAEIRQAQAITRSMTERIAFEKALGLNAL